jgi:hypothetical protein
MTEGMMNERIHLVTEYAISLLPDGELLGAWNGAQRGGRVMQFTRYQRAHLISLIKKHGASKFEGQDGFQILLPNGDYLQVDTKRKAQQ